MDSNLCGDQGESESEPEGRTEEFMRAQFAGGEEDPDDGASGRDAEGDAVGAKHPLAMDAKQKLQQIAAQLEKHAHQELEHALIISRQIDYLGAMPSVTPKPVKTSENARDMLKFDLNNENETVINYRERIRQCEALNEFAMAEPVPGASRHSDETPR